MTMIACLLWLAIFTTTHAVDPKQDYPYPRIVIIGQDANLISLCQTVNGRLSPSTITILLEFESMIGRERLWDNVRIEVSKWPNDEQSIVDRERQGITEENKLKDINDHIGEMAHLQHPIEGIFLDSWATYYQNDEVQQSSFYMYAKKLWGKSQFPTQVGTLYHL